jgi:hypothetical protein
LLRALRDLRVAAARGRPISLPNLLRLYQRLANAAGAEKDGYAALLRQVYRSAQPFKLSRPSVKLLRDGLAVGPPE